MAIIKWCSAAAAAAARTADPLALPAAIATACLWRGDELPRAAGLDGRSSPKRPLPRPMQRSPPKGNLPPMHPAAGFMTARFPRMSMMGVMSFEDPCSADHLIDEPGVYIVGDVHADAPYPLTDVGESSKVATRVRGHDRKRCRKLYATQGQYAFAVMYTGGRDARQRRRIEKRIRKFTSLPCGDL